MGAEIGSAPSEFQEVTMILFNNTKIPDELLKPLLKAAARAVGARLGKVPVKLTQGRYSHTQGHFHNCLWVKRWALTGVRKWDRNEKLRPAWKKDDRKVYCDGGYIRLAMPAHNGSCSEDEIGPMVRFCFEIMMHEFAHVADAQEYKVFRSSYPFPGAQRRKKWGRRHIEVSAIDRVDAAIDRGAIERNIDALIDLATWYHERARKDQSGK